VFALYAEQLRAIPGAGGTAIGIYGFSRAVPDSLRLPVDRYGRKRMIIWAC